jgi:hypothetical protein
MKLSDYTLALLDDIERRIDPETEEDYCNQWNNFFDKKIDEKVFYPRRKVLSDPGTELKNININDALSDLDLMIAKELTDLSRRLSHTDPSLGIRANYGTGIMTSLFGAEIFEMPRETDTLPTTRALEDSDKIREIMEKGIPDLHNGFGGRVLEFGEACAEIFEKYPKIKKYVQIYHPDTQGPLDIAELLWGNEMFYEMYDDPDFVKDFMRLITDTYKAFMDKWYSIIPMIKNGLNVHWRLMYRGTIFLRSDSAMNLSSEFHKEFSLPYDKELLDYYGGGCMHFCGRGDHYIEGLLELDSLFSINMSQPHLNDMNKILDLLKKHGKTVLGLPSADEYAERMGMPHGFIMG